MRTEFETPIIVSATNLLVAYFGKMQKEDFSKNLNVSVAMKVKAKHARYFTSDTRFVFQQACGDTNNVHLKRPKKKFATKQILGFKIV